MSISLEKGQKIDLEKGGALSKIRAGLGWDANQFASGGTFDLDVSVFVCKNENSNPKLLSDKHFVFYGNKSTPNGSVVHSGDNLTGDAVGDDESINIDLTKLEADVTEISFIVTIYKADERGQKFGMVKNSFIRLVDEAGGGKEIAKFSLEDDFSVETAVQFGSLYKKDGHWRFSAVGAGFKKGLDQFVQIYGGNLA
jgi:tellurium resistance protein TerD